MQHFKHFKREKSLESRIDLKNPNGRTPLHVAFINGQIEMVQFWIKDSKSLTLFFRRKIFGIKIQILFWGWFWTIVNSTQDSFLQLCQFSLIIIKLWNLMKKSIFLGEKKGTLGNFTTKTNLWRNSLYFKWELMQCQDKVYLLHDCNSYL